MNFGDTVNPVGVWALTTGLQPGAGTGHLPEPEGPLGTIELSPPHPPHFPESQG